MEQQKIRNSLFILRMGVLIVMALWTIDKILNPDHAASIFRNFYLIDGLGNTTIFIIAGIQATIVLAFALGYKKKYSYGAILIMHGISTLSSYKLYLTPFVGSSMLFFAAWPMLAACFVLWYLRDLDTKYSIG